MNVNKRHNVMHYRFTNMYMFMDLVCYLTTDCSQSDKKQIGKMRIQVFYYFSATAYNAPVDSGSAAASPGGVKQMTSALTLTNALDLPNKLHVSQSKIHLLSIPTDEW